MYGDDVREYTPGSFVCTWPRMESKHEDNGPWLKVKTIVHACRGCAFLSSVSLFFRQGGHDKSLSTPVVCLLSLACSWRLWGRCCVRLGVRLGDVVFGSLTVFGSMASMRSNG